MLTCKRYIEGERERERERERGREGEREKDRDRERESERKWQGPKQDKIRENELNIARIC